MSRRTAAIALSAAALLLAIPLSASATPADGALDVPFSTNTGTSMPHASVSLALQADGKILTANVDYVFRLNADGTATTPPNGQLNSNQFDGIMSIALDSSNKILIGGTFQQGDCLCSSRGITRMLPNGTIDSSFNAGIGVNGQVQDIQVLSDGRILIAGSFSTFDGVAVGPIVRLLPDGTLDSSWTLDPAVVTTANSAVELLPDGSVLTSGTQSPATNNAYVYKLNSSGRLINSFSLVTCTPGSGRGFGQVTSMKQTPTGAFVLAGTFDGCAGDSSIGISQVTASGAADTSFHSGGGLSGGSGGEYGVDVFVQQDGKILLTGVFSGYSTTTTNGIVRLLSNGNVDPSFELGGGFDFANQGRSITLQPAGGILIGGIITGFNGIPVGNIIRLYNAPDLPPTPTPINPSLPNTGMNSGLAWIVAGSGVSLLLVGFILIRMRKKN